MASSALSFKYESRSDIGKVRSENQDSFAVYETQEWSLFLVCDGMGGTHGGALASSLANEVVLHLVKEETNLSRDALVSAIKKANSLIHSYGEKTPGFEEMGTTMIALLSTPTRSFVAHVGDSRLYQIRNKKISKLTKDHTWVQELVDSGAMDPVKAEKSPVSHLLTRSLGTNPQVEVESHELGAPRKGDIYLLCSDGLYNLVSDQEILDLAKKGAFHDISSFADLLVEKALTAGGKDNVTVMCVRVDPEVDPERDSLLGDFPRVALSTKSGLNVSGLLDEVVESKSLFDVVEEVQTSVLEENKIFHDAPSALRLVPYFLLGVFSSVVVLLFLAIKTSAPSVSPNISPEVNGALQDASLQAAKVKEKIRDPRIIDILKSVQDREANRYQLVYSVSPSPYADRKYLSEVALEKTQAFFALPSAAPKILLPRVNLNDSRTSSEGRPSRPIVWENEQRLVEELRFRSREDAEETLTSNEEKSDNDSSSLLLSEDENISLIEDKEQIRSQIRDTDEKIRQLGLKNEQEKSRQVSDVKVRLGIFEDELLEIETESARLKTQGIVLGSFLGELYDNKEVQIAERLSPLKPELKSRIVQLRNIQESLDRTKKLLSQKEDQIDLANKIGALNREYDSVLGSIREMCKNYIESQKGRIYEHRALLFWTMHLVTLEKISLERALGFLDAKIELSPMRRSEMHEMLVERRNELYKELSALRSTLSDEEEYRINIQALQKMSAQDFS